MLKKISSFLKNKLNLYQNQINKSIAKLNNNTHQLTTTTKFNRYPEIFTICQKYMDGMKDTPKILSFGCSTGEECFSLRTYFPKSKIIGSDINKQNIKYCKKVNSDENISFIYSSKDELMKESKFDIIYCMSVLCRWEDTKDIVNCENIYPFTRFDSILSELNGYLKENGLLVIYNSNFRFSDSTIYNQYKVISDSSINESGFVTKFDNKNQVLKDQNYDHCIFQKMD